MKKKIHTTAVILTTIALSLLVFSYSVRHNNNLKNTGNIPGGKEVNEAINKKNQFDLPFLESLTRHLLALGH